MFGPRYRRFVRPLIPSALRVALGPLLAEVRIGLRLARGYGHYRSMRQDECVDSVGNALPWYTYPAIEFLDSLDFSNARVFEYGSGNSTLFWSDRVRSVVAVEHNPDWHARISGVTPPNAKLVLCEDKAAYPGVPGNEGAPFDVIAIDGTARQDCAREAASFIAPNGMILLDNSEWYGDTTEWLRAQGFIQVDFHGFCPLAIVAACTSIFFRGDVAWSRRPELNQDVALADRTGRVSFGGAYVTRPVIDAPVSPSRSFRSGAIGR